MCAKTPADSSIDMLNRQTPCADLAFVLHLQGVTATLPNLKTVPSRVVIPLPLVVCATQLVITATLDGPLQRAGLTSHGVLSRVLVSLVSVGTKWHACPRLKHPLHLHSTSYKLSTTHKAMWDQGRVVHAWDLGRSKLLKTY